MSKQTSSIGEIIESWTQAEQDAWKTWSAVEQDLSQPESASNCTHALDAVESYARDVARLQSAILCTTCEQMSANPFMPPPARMWFAQACGALVSLSDMQQHLLVGCFGMLRQAAEPDRR
jgi:hypothetical protein